MLNAFFILIEKKMFANLDGKLVSIETNESFKFDVYEDNDENQKRYETIGKLIDEAVYEKLESECHLNRVTVPVC